jgi:low affinity Fe/Cu permease
VAVSNEQIYIMIGVPMLFNAFLFALLQRSFNRGGDRIDRRFDEAVQRLSNSAASGVSTRIARKPQQT